MSLTEMKKETKIKKVTEIDWSKAPQDGYVLACLRQGVWFQKLNDAMQEQIVEQQGSLLELHVFNSEMEYRLLRCETGEFIEAVVADGEEDDKKVEIVKTIERSANDMGKSGFYNPPPYLQIVNYIRYDKEGMLSVNNYRLAPWEGGR